MDDFEKLQNNSLEMNPSIYRSYCDADFYEKNPIKFTTRIYADIINTLLFSGEQIVEWDRLVEGSPHSNEVDFYDDECKQSAIYMIWNKQIIFRFLMGGLPNFNLHEFRWPTVACANDGIRLSDDPLARVLPVITIVLNFNFAGTWDTVKSMMQVYDVPEKFAPFINDYKLNIFDIAFLPKETINMFKSDFRILAEALAQMRETLFHLYRFTEYKDSVEKEYQEGIYNLLSTLPVFLFNANY